MQDYRHEGVPDEPGTAIRDSAILPPRAEMMPASDALPAGADDREVVLPNEHMLALAPETVSKVRFMEVPVVEAKTFASKANRSKARGLAGDKDDEGCGSYLEYSRRPDSSKIYGSDCPEITMLRGSPSRRVVYCKSESEHLHNFHRCGVAHIEEAAAVQPGIDPPDRVLQRRQLPIFIPRFAIQLWSCKRPLTVLVVKAHGRGADK